MSIVVKGMDMPKDCRECLMQVYYSSGKTWCKPADRLLADDYKPIIYDDKPDWCPLVELHEHHGRLIDADALMDIFADRLEKISERYGIHSAVAGAVSGAMKLLDIQPTVLEKE